MSDTADHKTPEPEEKRQKTDGGERQQDSQGDSQQRRLPFWRMMLSVLQASFGVQSRENKERDFTQGSIAGFIAAALIFTVIFVLALMFIVSLVTD